MPGFDDVWAETIPAARWPSALLDAVRVDVGALGLKRSIATLRAWQHDAATSPEARDWLDALARALVESGTAPLSSDLELDPLPATPPFGQRPREVVRPFPDGASEETTDPRTHAVTAVGSSAGTQLIKDASILSIEEEEPETAAMTIPPQVSEAPGDARPPASEERVRTLAASLKPLVDELIPLPPPRRPRRFWAHWREVAGDRGVRRDFVETLLGRAETARELLAELIAEIEVSDIESVEGYLATIEAERTPPPGT